MLSRRGFLAASALPVVWAGEAARAEPAAPFPPGVPASGTLAFRITRHGSTIGEHHLAFTARPGGLSLAITVDIAVKFGPIPVFHYRLRGTESWAGGVCTYSAANTDDDGTKAWMRAERVGGALRVRGSRVAPYAAPPTALPASHWNKAELARPWINIEDGRLFHPEVRDTGPDPVRLASGATVPATRYDLSGDVHLQMWYAGQVWAGLQFSAHDGSIIQYERL